MPTLTDEIKTFIVMSLARYDTPSEVAKAVKANFAVELTRQHVHNYDPACANPPAQRWIDLHAATRAAFLRDQAQIGIAQQSFRLRMLDRMAHRALAMNYWEMVAGFLDQAARECGGHYDRRKVPLADPVTLEQAARETAAKPGLLAP